MKKLIAIAAALLLCTAPFATAADAPPAAKKAPTTKLDKLAPESADTPACHKMEMMGGGMGMMGSGMGMGAGNAMSPELMKKMQDQMTKIRETSDPAERQKLMQEHFQSMQEAMQALRGNMGGMGCCCQQCPQAACAKKPNCKGGKCARGKGSLPQGGAMGSNPAGMMEQRMDMMQMMMENMMEHQRQMQPSK